MCCQRVARFMCRLWPFRASQLQIRRETVARIDALIDSNQSVLDQRKREQARDDADFMRSVRLCKRMPMGSQLEHMQTRSRSSLLGAKRIHDLEGRRQKLEAMKDTIDVIMRLKDDIAAMQEITDNVQMLGVDSSSELLTKQLDEAMAKWKNLSEYAGDLNRGQDSEQRHDSESAISTEEVNRHLTELFEQMHSSALAGRVQAEMDLEAPFLILQEESSVQMMLNC
jgi:DNA mismatch repair ATPase MutS